MFFSMEARLRSLPDWEHRSNRATYASFWPCELSLSTFLTTQGTQAFVGKRGAPPKDHKNLMRALSISFITIMATTGVRITSIQLHAQSAVG